MKHGDAILKPAFRLSSNQALIRFVLIQAAVLSIFVTIVYSDRLILEEILKPYNLLAKVRLFHWAFFDVMGSLVFAMMGLVYFLAGGRKSWPIGAAIFAEGLILLRLGMEDFLYYLMFAEAPPSQMPWLNWNPVFVATTYIVTRTGLELAVFLSLASIAGVWILVRRNL